jgi:two-component system OmpR family response regulator
MARILVAEDDVHVMRLMSIWLGKSGHEVVEACNGAEAKKFLAAGGIDCLVTDANMPICDGIELVQWLRREAQLKIPITMLSARCDQDNIHEKLAGMDVTLHAKPFSPSRLSVEIEQKLAASKETANA